MSVKIRLLRAGAKHRPFYRVVVTDSRSPRDGRFIETLGYYDPLPDKQLVKIDEEKAKQWIERGAKPSDTVKALLKRASTFSDADELAEQAKARRAEAIAEANRLAPPPKQKSDDKERSERGAKAPTRGSEKATTAADTQQTGVGGPKTGPAKAEASKPDAPEGAPSKAAVPKVAAKPDDTPKPDAGGEGK